jgi:hypothetical protein
MSALFETSVFGSGVSWASKAGPSAAKIIAGTRKRARNFMCPMLSDAPRKAEAISGRWIERSALHEKEWRRSRK